MENIFSSNKEIGMKIEQLAEVGFYFWERGWAERNAGNISINITDLVNEEIKTQIDSTLYKLQVAYPELSGKLFLITGTGKRMRDLARKPMENLSVIKISDDGKEFSLPSINNEIRSSFIPTSELPAHLSIHSLIAKRGSNEKVVLHTHLTEIIALTQIPEYQSEEALNRILWGMHPEAMVFVPKGIGYVPYILPGSQKIADETLKAFKKHDIVVWEKHGCFAVGEDVFETFDSLDIMAKSVKIFFLCKSAGFSPEGLNENQLQELKKYYG